MKPGDIYKRKYGSEVLMVYKDGRGTLRNIVLLNSNLDESCISGPLKGNNLESYTSNHWEYQGNILTVFGELYKNK